jgi:OmpA family
MANADFLADVMIQFDPPAAFRKRLINFTTGSYALTSTEHQNWLRETARLTNTTKEFTCQIFGWASKLGNHADNEKLSYNRANSVAKFLENLNPLYTSRIDHFKAEGDDYTPKSKDPNDPAFRAVEVHVFWGKAPAPPHDVKPVSPRQVRTGLNWSVTNKGFGTQSNPVDWLPAQVALNLFAFRNDETRDVGLFLAPMFGAGMDVLGAAQAILKSLKGAGKLKGLSASRFGKIIQFDEWLVELGLKLLKASPREFYEDLVKGLVNFSLLDTSFSPTDFTKAKVFLPVTLRMIDGATIANAAVQLGYKSNYGSLYVYGQAWYTESSGKRMFGMRNFLEVPPSWSTQYQFPNAGASFLGGPLIRL